MSESPNSLPPPTSGEPAGNQPAAASDVTALLEKLQAGDRSGLDRLTSLLYDELHRLASAQMRGERRSHTLQTTALVNEAYLRLVDQKHMRWKNRAHFLAIAAKTIRRVLVDHSRKRRAVKRGHGYDRVTLQGDEALAVPAGVDVIALDLALNKLARLDQRMSRVVELRFFGGLAVKETAAVLGISAPTVKREWRLARAWLMKELHSA